jgi:hypothetical protein
MTPRELMTEYLAAARRGDWDAAFAHFADDILIRVPGRSEWAGERRGRAAVAGYIEAVRNRYRSTWSTKSCTSSTLDQSRRPHGLTKSIERPPQPESRPRLSAARR